jgi:hypothetical protein
MHAFEHRLTQLLECVEGLTAGRRQRLARSLRQDDVELGVRAENAGLDAAMKAALRVAAHETLDAFCVHLEGALARCRSDHARMLVMALTAIVLAEHGCVLFAVEGEASGVEFPAAETVVIEPAPNAVIDVALWSRANATGGLQAAVLVFVGDGGGDLAADTVVVAADAIEADPFAEAGLVLAKVRGMDAQRELRMENGAL